MPVVISKHCDDRRLELVHGLDERRDLSRLAVQRQVACEQDQIRLAGGVREDCGEALVAGPSRMNVSGRCDFDHTRTVPRNPSLG